MALFLGRHVNRQLSRNFVHLKSFCSHGVRGLRIKGASGFRAAAGTDWRRELYIF